MMYAMTTRRPQLNTVFAQIILYFFMIDICSRCIYHRHMESITYDIPANINIEQIIQNAMSAAGNNRNNAIGIAGVDIFMAVMGPYIDITKKNPRQRANDKQRKIDLYARDEQNGVRMVIQVKTTEAGNNKMGGNDKRELMAYCAKRDWVPYEAIVDIVKRQIYLAQLNKALQ
jgi:hypothetical protein